MLPPSLSLFFQANFFIRRSGILGYKSKPDKKEEGGKEEREKEEEKIKWKPKKRRVDEHIGRNSWNYQHAFSADVILCEYNNACLLYQLGRRRA